MPTNAQILLDSRPSAAATLSNFKLVTQETPALQDGQVLVRHHFLSLDPYMRGRMNDAKSYTAPQALGEVMGGWQTYSVVNAATLGALRKVDTTHVPLSYYLGAVGMPGVTAWYGLVHILEAQAGQTVVVSAATGAVGSAFAALAKKRACRVVGIAGGPAKCDYATTELGFDACIDYKQHTDAASLSSALKEVCPDGVDGYFENVGGMVLDAVMLRMNDFGRIALCGMIAGYDGKPLPMNYPALILRSRLKIQGFIVTEHLDVWPQALQELGELVATGKLRPRESVAQGLAAAPEAFLGLLKGQNFGKQIVKLM